MTTLLFGDTVSLQFYKKDTIIVFNHNKMLFEIIDLNQRACCFGFKIYNFVLNINYVFILFVFFLHILAILILYMYKLILCFALLKYKKLHKSCISSCFRISRQLSPFVMLNRCDNFLRPKTQSSKQATISDSRAAKLQLSRSK